MGEIRSFWSVYRDEASHQYGFLQDLSTDLLKMTVSIGPYTLC
jgi:hypothetical protein